MAVSVTAARATVHSRSLTADQAFDVLAAVGRQGAFDDTDQARDMLIRILDQRAVIPATLVPLLQGLIREHGLFPYLEDVDNLGLADQIAYEAHRPTAQLREGLVFHAEQAMVYERLLAGENVVLSAPTSFGKSLVVDAVLAQRDFRNAAVVVPTIALMDEARRRLARLGDKYKIITHGSQEFAERNLLIMTQERLLEVQGLDDLDFFAIDEFYKLDPAHSDDRSNQLNILFRQLLATGAQYYLIGPNITGLSDPTGQRLRATFINTGFTTVATDVERLNVAKDDLPEVLADTCRAVGGGTLIFCKSPARTREVATWLLERGIGGGTDLQDAADWIGEAYHPQWLVSRALRAGIGIHHGKLPRALGHHLVRLFNEGRLPYLLVTSTLIEGVNTSARNVIVLDNKIANKKYDYFTFANIRGRSGRMLRHYVGRVVVFNPEPKPADLTVDVPSLSQSSKVSDEILIQLPEDELSERSRQQLQRYYDQQLVSLDVLRRHKGMSPSRQLDAADKLAAEPARWGQALTWNGSFPTTSQIRDLGEVLFTLTGSGNAVRSAKQLGARVNMLRNRRGDLRALVKQDVDNGKSPDDAVEDALDFARNWAQFKIPTALTAIGHLAQEVLTGSQPTSDTTVFAGQLENMFQLPFTTVLEEYGLPTSLTSKLEGQLGLATAADLDEVLRRISQLASEELQLGPFETEMLTDTQAGL